MQETESATIKPCPRCGREVIASKSGNQQARPVRKSDKGMCLECTVTSIMLGLPSAGMFPKEAMLLPHIQDQFAAVLRAGDADPEAHAIDWQRVVDNWELPFPRKFAPAKT